MFSTIQKYAALPFAKYFKVLCVKYPNVGCRCARILQIQACAVALKLATPINNYIPSVYGFKLDNNVNYSRMIF